VGFAIYEGAQKATPLLSRLGLVMTTPSLKALRTFVEFVEIRTQIWAAKADGDCQFSEKD
jgi:hypothetical protein